MIFDCLMLRNELDVLQMRLEEISDLVDFHVICEARQDFHGKPKSLAYDPANARWAKWKHKIQHVVVGELPDDPNPWVREHYQRDAAYWYLSTVASPEDTVLICDADEIPSPVAILKAMTVASPIGLSMRTCHSAVDWLYPTEMPGSVIAKWKHIQGHKLSEVRDGRSSYLMFSPGGWHLSWLSAEGSQLEKLNVTCHLELPQQEVSTLRTGSGYRTGSHIDVQMVPVEVDETWPKYIYQRRCPPLWFRPR